jgi:hypothetical protein
MARTTAWLERDALLKPTSQKQPACRRKHAPEHAVAESDELQTVDVDHVCGRKQHDFVNTVHMEGGGADAETQLVLQQRCCQDRLLQQLLQRCKACNRKIRRQ